MSQEISVQDLYPLQDRLEALENKMANASLEYEEQVEADQLRDQVWAAQDEFGGIVYRIPEQRIEELRTKIEKMVKRANKLGINPPTFTDTGERELVVVNRKEQQDWAYVIVGGHPPVLGGWTFLATLQHEEAGTIIRRIPGLRLYGEQRDDILAKLDLSQYRSAQPVCDHCNTRRIRRDTYLVLHEDGEIKQVGSNCLQDFTGGLNPQQAAKGVEYIIDSFDAARKVQGEGFSGLRPESVFDTEEFMAHTALIVRKNGWVSRAKSEEWDKPSTAGLTRSNLFNYLDQLRDRDGHPLWEDPTDEDVEFGKAALAYARALPGKSDYEHNLKIALAGDTIKTRSAGIVASAVGIYKMNLDRENPKDKAPRLNEWFGTEKERLVLTLTVKKTWLNQGGYGDAYYTHIMSDAEGRTFMWYGSYELEEGETYTGKWTIKRHQEHDRYGKQTVVNRPKLDS